MPLPVTPDHGMGAPTRHDGTPSNPFTLDNPHVLHRANALCAVLCAYFTRTREQMSALWPNADLLEERGLLKRIGVVAHPRPEDGLPGYLLRGEGLEMGLAFSGAYEAAENFSKLYARRCPGAGFLKTILLRRIGSSAKAGLETARRLLTRLDGSLVPEEEMSDEGVPVDAVQLDQHESQLLREVERNLAAVVSDNATTMPRLTTILVDLIITSPERM